MSSTPINERTLASSKRPLRRSFADVRAMSAASWLKIDVGLPMARVQSIDGSRGLCVR